MSQLKRNFQKYAYYYDILYRSKPYKKECDFVEKIFKKYSRRKINSIFDLGCGTGSHDLILAKRGYSVAGVDLSPDLIKIAKRKAKKNKLKINFKEGDLRTVKLNKKFDAVILLFNVINFQTTNQDIIFAFKTISKHLKRGGLCIFDFWSGSAVLNKKPEKRLKIVEIGNEKIIKITEPTLNIFDNTVNTHYKIIRLIKNKVRDKFNQDYKIRYFFPQEIQYFFEKENFQILKFCPFMKLNKTPTIEDWNIVVIAKKR